MIDVLVTQEQRDQMEVAWMLCAYPGKRKLRAEDAWAWRESELHILGFVPDGDYRLVVHPKSTSNP